MMKGLSVPFLAALLVLVPAHQAQARGSHSSSHRTSTSTPKSYTNTAAPVHVKGYYKKNGTYVAPHYRSHPDKSYNNNWSVKGNVNPYTGKAGTKNPTANDKPPPKNPSPPTI